MTTNVLDRQEIAIKQPPEHIRNQINSFIITATIDAKKIDHFIKYINTFEILEQATISPKNRSVQIKIQTTNEKLDSFVLLGVHHYPDVQKVSIKLS
ncbi:MAG: hypothetical protein V3U84_06040 [Thiotrichaceae bacterium]